MYTPTAGYTGPDQFNYKATRRARRRVRAHHAPPRRGDPGARRHARPTTPVDGAPERLPLVLLQLHATPFGERAHVRDRLASPRAARSAARAPPRFFNAGPEEGDATFTWHAHSESRATARRRRRSSRSTPTPTAAPTCQAYKHEVLGQARCAARRSRPLCMRRREFDLADLHERRPTRRTARSTVTDGVHPLHGRIRFTAARTRFTFRVSDDHGLPVRASRRSRSTSRTRTRRRPASPAPTRSRSKRARAVLFTSSPCSDSTATR